MGQRQSIISEPTPIPQVQAASLALNEGKYDEATKILNSIFTTVSSVDLVKTAAAHRIVCLQNTNNILHLSQTLAMYEHLAETRPENEMLKTLVIICREDLSRAKEVEKMREGVLNIS
jgi:hypothetical protein